MGAAGLGREVLTWATRDDDLDDCFGQKCHGEYGRIYLRMDRIELLFGPRPCRRGDAVYRSGEKLEKAKTGEE